MTLPLGLFRLNFFVCWSNPVILGIFGLVNTGARVVGSDNNPKLNGF